MTRHLQSKHIHLYNVSVIFYQYLTSISSVLLFPDKGCAYLHAWPVWYAECHARPPCAGTGYALHRSGLPAVSDTALGYSHTLSTDQDLPEQAVFPDYLPQITAFVSSHRY